MGKRVAILGSTGSIGCNAIEVVQHLGPPYSVTAISGNRQIDKLIETFKDDVDLIYNVDPVAAQLLDAKSLKPGLGDLTAEMVKRYKAATGAQEVPPHTSMGFNQAWIFLSDVLPRAIKKYGGFDPEALRKAIRDHLRKHPAVKSWRPVNENEGGDGATVAVLDT